MRNALIFLVGCLLSAVSAFAGDAYFRETIDNEEITRTTFVAENPEVVFWQTELPGNPEFGAPTNSLSFVHSVRDIDPALLPDGMIRQLRLKLFLHYKNKDEDECEDDHDGDIESEDHDGCEEDGEDEGECEDDNESDDDHIGEELVITVDSIDLDNFHRRHFLIGPEPSDSISVDESILQDGNLEIVISSSDNSESRFVLKRSVMDVIYTPSFPLDVPGDVAQRPESPILTSNYPNPFNPSTTIEYYLPTRSDVRVEVLNMLGQTVRVLVDAPVSAGPHRVVWDGLAQNGSQVSSGVYYYRIVAGDLIKARKMILMK